ncbi:Epoxyqueuosine (oQ) reductase QueG [Geitlerinema sp. FC II]|nr:Epoxyqueuosine (oQ) reductase QueG [Geitlerinema sp. FC II]
MQEIRFCGTRVSIPQRDFGEFQLSRRGDGAQTGWFQSLKGILVNFNAVISPPLPPSPVPVSIPQRDFGEFQLDNSSKQGQGRLRVSIPQRDFGEFQQARFLRHNHQDERFNPSKGFW